MTQHATVAQAWGAAALARDLAYYVYEVLYAAGASEATGERPICGPHTSYSEAAEHRDDAQHEDQRRVFVVRAIDRGPAPARPRIALFSAAVPAGMTARWFVRDLEWAGAQGVEVFVADRAVDYESEWWNVTTPGAGVTVRYRAECEIGMCPVCHGIEYLAVDGMCLGCAGEGEDVDERA